MDYCDNRLIFLFVIYIILLLWRRAVRFTRITIPNMIFYLPFRSPQSLSNVKSYYFPQTIFDIIIYLTYYFVRTTDSVEKIKIKVLAPSSLLVFEAKQHFPFWKILAL